MYLILVGGVILALKFINVIISFILSDFLLGLGTILIVGGAIITASKLVKENQSEGNE